MRTVSVSPNDVERKPVSEMVDSIPTTLNADGKTTLKNSFVSKILSPQMIGLVSLIGVITLWLTSSILTHDILKEYNKPVLMSFVSVASMQVYFVFLKLKDPLYNYLESKVWPSLFCINFLYYLSLEFVRYQNQRKHNIETSNKKFCFCFN
jgi:hypothetical protein